MADTIDTSKAVYDAQVEAISATHGDSVVVNAETFNFRSVKSKDAEGNTVSTKRASIKLPLIVPSLRELQRMIDQGGAELELVRSAILDVVYREAYGILTDSPEMTADQFPLEKLVWSAIATQPVETRQRGVDAEELKAFVADYKEVMPSITGKAQARVDNAATAFAQKFSRYRTSPEILKTLREQLDIYTERASNAGNFSDTLAWLSAKLDELLAASPDEIVAL